MLPNGVILGCARFVKYWLFCINQGAHELAQNSVNRAHPWAPPMLIGKYVFLKDESH